MSNESKEIDSEVGKLSLEETVEGNSTGPPTTDKTAEDEAAASTNSDVVAAASNVQKKKSKKTKIKKLLGGGGGENDEGEASGSSANPASKLTSDMVEQLLQMNPSLKSELEGMDKEKAAEAVKKLDVSDLLTGFV